MYKHTGTINGVGNFGFLLTAIDGQSIARTVPPESVQTAPFLAARILLFRFLRNNL